MGDVISLNKILEVLFNEFSDATGTVCAPIKPRSYIATGELGEGVRVHPDSMTRNSVTINLFIELPRVIHTHFHLVQVRVAVYQIKYFAVGLHIGVACDPGFVCFVKYRY